MNKEPLETFLRSIKEGSKNPRLVHLCEALEAFMALYASRNQGEQGSVAYETKLKASTRALWDSFDAAAESFGIEGQRFLKNIVNPAHVTPEGLEGMNRLQQSLEAIQGPAPACKGKKKSRKKNVRI
jgi:hypothetical protein